MAAGMEVASLYARIGADTKSFETASTGVKNELNTLQSGFQAWGKAAAIGMAAAGAAIAGAGAVIFKTGVEFNAMKEQAQVAFTTMLGSGEKAQAFLLDLQKFAATTPFEFPELVQASQRLLAMGFAAKDVKPTLTAIGDAVAALGGSSELVNRVTIALGQMGAKGKVSAEEMLQLTEAGIPAWDILANKIGVSIPDAMKQASKGAISADTAIAALVEGMNTRFGGMMEAQSQTFNGLISTIRDNASILAGQIIAPMFDRLRDGLKRVADAMSFVTENLGKMKLAYSDGSGIISNFLTIMGLNEEKALAIGQAFAVWIERIQSAWEFITELSATLRATLAPLADLIGRFVSWKDVLIALGAILGGIVLSAIGTIVAAFAPMLAVLATVTTAVSLLRWAWENDIGRIRSFTQAAFGQLSDWLDKHFHGWQQNWGSMTGFMLGDTKITVPLVVAQFLGQIEKLRVEAIWKVQGFVATWKTRLEDWRNEGRRIVEQFIIDWKTNIDHWVGLMKEKFNSWVEYLVLNIWGGLRRKTQVFLNNLSDDWQELMDRLFGWFKPKEWEEMGRGMLQGLWNGIQGIWDRFTSWWRQRWLGLKEGWKQLWQEHSPSKFFEQSGMEWMKGLQIGIDKNAANVIGSLRGVSQDVATANTGAYGMGGNRDGELAAAINALVSVLGQGPMGNQISVSMSGTGSAPTDLRATVEYLQALYA